MPHTESPDVIQSNAEALAARAARFAITSAEEYEAGVEELRKIQRLRKSWDALQRPAIRAADHAHKEAVRVFKSIDSKLESAFKQIKTLCERWADDQRRAREQYYKMMSELVKPAQLDAAFDAAVANGDKAKAERILQQTEMPATLQPAVPLVPPVDAPSVPKVSGVAMGTPYTYEIIDEAQIPRAYLMPDRKKIAAVVKAMGAQTHIPGIVVRPETSLTIRG
jgi:hypothetical protein